MSSKLIIESDLQSYFFSKLSEINSKSLTPLPDKIIFYTSEVLKKYSDPEVYFEKIDGRYKEKILGIKLLKTNELDLENKKSALKDIGDTSLCLCGFFPSSVRKKTVDLNYYQELGRSAYLKLDSFVPNLLDTPSFYQMLSSSFPLITSMFAVILKEQKNNQQIFDLYNKWLKNENKETNQKSLSSLGVYLDENNKKAN